MNPLQPPTLKLLFVAIYVRLCAQLYKPYYYYLKYKIKPFVQYNIVLCIYDYYTIKLSTFISPTTTVDTTQNTVLYNYFILFRVDKSGQIFDVERYWKVKTFKTK